MEVEVEVEFVVEVERARRPLGVVDPVRYTTKSKHTCNKNIYINLYSFGSHEREERRRRRFAADFDRLRIAASLGEARCLLC